jgi:hypothetical protein
MNATNQQAAASAPPQFEEAGTTAATVVADTGVLRSPRIVSSAGADEEDRDQQQRGSVGWEQQQQRQTPLVVQNSSGRNGASAPSFSYVPLDSRTETLNNAGYIERRNRDESKNLQLNDWRGDPNFGRLDGGRQHNSSPSKRSNGNMNYGSYDRSTNRFIPEGQVRSPTPSTSYIVSRKEKSSKFVGSSLMRARERLQEFKGIREAAAVLQDSSVNNDDDYYFSKSGGAATAYGSDWNADSERRQQQRETENAKTTTTANNGSSRQKLEAFKSMRLKATQEL